ncbi:restriction endonuclease subunit S [Laribacter hongkongensis]|uniref:restriction endonuclease subunit S n=1 Tax=Laribacter hongkongensis TaxID=168471 RepID=UPI001EFC939C|nr:restriction endonuclease subunit S [Laribacter hongkongensis]MCG9124881.1 restriction endonuclease subunit S [Laribacter hongkongensis]
MSFNLPELPESWTYASLGDCSQKNSITYGVVQPGTAVSDGTPIVRVNNFRNLGLDLSDVMRISPEVEAKYSRTRLKGGEVLLTIVGSVGQVAVVPNCLAGFNVARAVAVIHPLPHVTPNWIALCLRSPLSQYLLGSRANTTVQTTINLKDLRALPIPLPPEDERQAISDFIGCLDDRITLLRETNATLDAIAQALFKSWFVDFDPVRAKQEGRAPEGMDEATAALFPDGLEESELGLVPMGWKLIRLDSFIELAYGKALKAENRNPGQVPVYGSGGITGWHDSALVNHASIIVGRKGTVGSIHWESRPFFPIDTVFYVKAQRPLTYCHQLLKTLGLHDMNTDAAVPGLNRDNVYRLLVPDASLSVINAFDDVVKGFRQAIDHNEQQVQTLSEVRDTLLPRLISGRLRMSSVNTHVEDLVS